MPKAKKKPVVPEINPAKVRMAFQNTAEACGGDILQCCRDCGEPAVIDREGLYDHLKVHGGAHGKEVQKWIYDFPGDMKQLELVLNKMNVPKTWR